MIYYKFKSPRLERVRQRREEAAGRGAGQALELHPPLALDRVDQALEPRPDCGRDYRRLQKTTEDYTRLHKTTQDYARLRKTAQD